MEYIVKYDNRKLYSKHLKKYVNLDYVIDLTKTNTSNFTIVKYEKGLQPNDMKDITGKVLAEAISQLNVSREKLAELIREA